MWQLLAVADAEALLPPAVDQQQAGLGAGDAFNVGEMTVTRAAVP